MNQISTAAAKLFAAKRQSAKALTILKGTASNPNTEKELLAVVNDDKITRSIRKFAHFTAIQSLIKPLTDKTDRQTLAKNCKAQVASLISPKMSLLLDAAAKQDIVAA